MNLIDTRETDPLWRGLVIAREAGCRWIAVPMFFNHRLVCVYDDDPSGCAAYGWCYRGMAALIASAAVFEPDAQDEPVGWHKRAGADVRRAPHRDQDPDHNRDRCVHGSYLHTRRCGNSQFCADFLDVQNAYNSTGR
jgi:hypothetical protein